MQRRSGRVFKGVAWVALSVALAVASVALAGALWLRSSSGHERVKRELLGFVNARMGGRFTVRRLSGPLLSAVTFEGIELINRRGEIAGRARAVYAEFSLVSLLRHRPQLTRVIVEAPELDGARVVGGLVDVSELRAELHRRNRHLAVEDLFIHDGRVDLAPTRAAAERIERLDLRGALVIEDHATRKWLSVSRLRARLVMRHGAPRPLEGSGELRIDPETLLAGRLELASQSSRLSATGRWGKSRVEISRVSAHLEPELLEQLSPKEKPPAAIDLQLSAHGPIEAIRVRAEVRPGPGRIAVEAVADARHWQVSGVAHHSQLSGAFFPGRPPFVLSGELHATARRTPAGPFVEGAIDHAAGVVANVVFVNGSLNGVIDHGVLRVGRAGMDVAGGSVRGRGEVAFRGDLHLTVRVGVTVLSKILALKKRRFELPTAPKGKSLLGVDLTVDKRKHEKAKTHVQGVHFGAQIARTQNGSPL